MIFLELKINKDTFLPVTAHPTSKLTDTENKLMVVRSEACWGDG